MNIQNRLTNKEKKFCGVTLIRPRKSHAGVIILIVTHTCALRRVITVAEIVLTEQFTYSEVCSGAHLRSMVPGQPRNVAAVVKRWRQRLI